MSGVNFNDTSNKATPADSMGPRDVSLQTISASSQFDPSSFSKDVCFKINNTLGSTVDVELAGGAFDGQIVICYILTGSSSCRFRHTNTVIGGSKDMHLSASTDKTLNDAMTIELIWDSTDDQWNMIAQSSNGG